MATKVEVGKGTNRESARLGLLRLPEQYQPKARKSHRAQANSLTDYQKAQDMEKSEMRKAVVRLANTYVSMTRVQRKDVWACIYNSFYRRTGIILNALPRKNKESLLDVAEKYGHLPTIHAIISAMVQNVANKPP